ncbi:MAG: SAM-dependent methyltransferase [Acholeplasmatales bacterium]|nr:SAM-dependent methyltransferase [Acholeplasmatales bacterium]
MENIIIPDGIIKGIISGKKKKDNKYEKCKIQRIKINDNDVIQLSLFTDKQVFHTNYNDSDISNALITLLENDFNNLELVTDEFTYSYRITSKGKVLSNKRKNKETVFVETSFNRKKKYILEEGTVVPALVDLGIMMPDGRVVKAGYDKFRQINRFLEIIDDSIGNEKYLKIIDFGCGKSYLTFILYYYLVHIKNMECEIIGLDLKEDVIDKCNDIAKKYNYDHLKFYKGDIAQYKDSKVDMIVTLHACDTATDYALYHAINMNCKYIFSVPCCQHEINNELSSDKLHIVNKFGILKERFSAILTDSIRANILQYFGYKTNVMEFVDFENSPKNLLIRAELKSKSGNEKIKEELDNTIKEFNIKQTLYELVFNDN